MVSWKEKVAEKLSHLFSDSSSSQSPVLDQSKARPHPNESKPLSSVLSLILPSSGFGGSKSIRDGNDVKPVQSPRVKWKSSSMSWQDKPLDCNEKCDNIWESRVIRNPCEDSQQCETGRSCESERMGASNSHEDGDPGSGRSTSSSEVFEDATDRYNIEKYMPYLTEESSFVYPELYQCLVSSLPNIVKGCQWVLLYSTIKHGISLRTLIRRSADLPGPCLLIVGDKQGAVFGGLLQSPLKPTPKRKYQGTNQTFVFTNIYGEPRLFRPTGANRFFYMCVNDLLALGGGGNYALCLNEDLLTGTSGPCETFGNLCLAHNEEFEMKNVELWGFTHASRYHS